MEYKGSKVWVLRCKPEHLDLAVPETPQTLGHIMLNYPLPFALATNANYFAGDKALGWMVENGTVWNAPEAMAEDEFWPIFMAGKIELSAGPCLVQNGIIDITNISRLSKWFTGFTAAGVTHQLAIGQDAQQNVVLVIADALNLWDLARFMVDQGVRYGIKLDGGDSVGLLNGEHQLVYGNTLRKLPSAIVMREVIEEDMAPKERKARDIMLAKNFNESEFACKCCGMVPFNGIDMTLVSKLQQMRDALNPMGGRRALIIESGYRCVKHNKEVGGEEGSFHLLGKAVDCKMYGKKPADIFKLAEQLGFGGIHAYESWTHVDTGPMGRRW